MSYLVVSFCVLEVGHHVCVGVVASVGNVDRAQFCHLRLDHVTLAGAGPVETEIAQSPVIQGAKREKEKKNEMFAPPNLLLRIIS